MDKQEILVNSQFALFFQQAILKPEKIWMELSERFEGIFDETPIILPVPDQAETQEIPIVQLNSSNGVYRIAISHKRVDFFIAGEGNQKFDNKKNIILGKGIVLFDFFKDITKIKRMAFIVRNFVEDNEPEKTISSKIFVPNFTALSEGSVYDSFVRYTTRINFESFETNNYTTLEKANINVGEDGSKVGVLITRDLNTIQEMDYSDGINTSSYSNFITAAATKASDLATLKSLIWQE